MTVSVVLASRGPTRELLASFFLLFHSQCNYNTQDITESYTFNFVGSTDNQNLSALYRGGSDHRLVQ